MRTPSFAATSVALLAAAAAAAQTPGPTPKPTPWAVSGPEFLVNTTTTGNQNAPAVAIDADHGFVAAWTTDQGGILARRFDKSGVPLSGEFQVNTTSGNQNGTAIASDSAGNFVVVWSSSPDATGGSDVFARRYDATGNPVGGEFLVNTYTTGYQHSARVVMSSSGIVVVWSSAPLPGQAGQDGDQSGIYGQRYSFNGVPIGGEFLVNTYTTGDQRAPSIDVEASSGYFGVVWESDAQDGDLSGIYWQLFQNSGAPIGSELQVNSHTTGTQTLPDVSYSGDFVVVWSSEGQDGSSSGVFGRAFQVGGNPLGPDFRVNTHTTGAQTRARVGRDPSFPRPGFVVVWESFGQDDPGSPGSSGVFAQRFNNAPFPTAQFYLIQPPARGAEYQINTYTTGSQSAPEIAFAPNGRFVVAWESFGQDGSGTGIVARRFNFPDAAPMSVDQSPSSGSSNVNGVLEAGERVVVDPSWSNHGNGGTFLPLFGSAANITGPPGPLYTIDDPDADYGNIQEGGTNECFFATGNCYEFTVSGTRPAAHWDATFDESPASFGPLGPAQTLTKTWGLHVGGSFPDVPQDAFYPHIENIFHNGVTAGGGCGAGLYCGEDGTLRQQMAVFLLKTAFGSHFVPPPATGAVFDDVPASDPFAPWIEDLARRGITAGCKASPPPALPFYCPTSPVNRQQMAVLLYKTYWGAIPPSSCTGIFDDVPCSNPFAPYVEYLFNSGVAAGCQASPPLYCPAEPTKRKQMAVFLVRTFGLQLYGPD